MRATLSEVSLQLSSDHVGRLHCGYPLSLRDGLSARSCHVRGACVCVQLKALGQEPSILLQRSSVLFPCVNRLVDCLSYGRLSVANQ